MTRIAVALAALAMVFAATAAADDPSPLPSTSVTPTSHAITGVTELERQVLVAVNAVRREHGLVPLRANRALGYAARAHSRSMAEKGFFRHTSADGSAFWKRLMPVYRQQQGRPWSMGENLVWRSPELTAEQAVDLWMKSPPHRKNLLTPAWRDIGIGGVHALAAPGVYEGLDVTIV